MNMIEMIIRESSTERLDEFKEAVKSTIREIESGGAVMKESQKELYEQCRYELKIIVDEIVKRYFVF